VKNSVSHSLGQTHGPTWEATRKIIEFLILSIALCNTVLYNIQINVNNLYQYLEFKIKIE